MSFVQIIDTKEKKSTFDHKNIVFAPPKKSGDTGFRILLSYKRPGERKMPFIIGVPGIHHSNGIYCQYPFGSKKPENGPDNRPIVNYNFHIKLWGDGEDMTPDMNAWHSCIENRILPHIRRHVSTDPEIFRAAKKSYTKATVNEKIKLFSWKYIKDKDGLPLRNKDDSFVKDLEKGPSIYPRLLKKYFKEG